MGGPWILGLNFLLAACVAAAATPAVPAPLRMLGAGLVVLVIPGLGWLKSNFALVLAFVLILVVLLFKPAGLYGTRRIERV